MATLTSALDTTFTPAVGDFAVQVTGGMAILEGRGTSGAAWAEVARIRNGKGIATCTVSGEQYRFRAVDSTAVVQADQ